MKKMSRKMFSSLLLFFCMGVVAHSDIQKKEKAHYPLLRHYIMPAVLVGAVGYICTVAKQLHNDVRAIQGAFFAGWIRGTMSAGQIDQGSDQAGGSGSQHRILACNADDRDNKRRFELFSYPNLDMFPDYELFKGLPHEECLHSYRIDQDKRHITKKKFSIKDFAWERDSADKTQIKETVIPIPAIEIETEHKQHVMETIHHVSIHYLGEREIAVLRGRQNLYIMDMEHPARRPAIDAWLHGDGASQDMVQLSAVAFIVPSLWSLNGRSFEQVIGSAILLNPHTLAAVYNQKLLLMKPKGYPGKPMNIDQASLLPALPQAALGGYVYNELYVCGKRLFWVPTVYYGMSLGVHPIESHQAPLCVYNSRSKKFVNVMNLKGFPTDFVASPDGRYAVAVYRNGCERIRLH
jgi:hypothetical protein